MHDLVRQATLAPSSHNTQCWRFRIAGKAISIAPDLARRCPVVDPDDHHVFVSLGCAAENMVHAALAHGLHANPRFDPGGDGAIAVNLEATQKRVSPLCVRLFTARPAIESVLRRVVAANTAQMNDAAFVKELKAWIRFGTDEALRTGDGLFAGATGNPALPRWLGSSAVGYHAISAK